MFKNKLKYLFVLQWLLIGTCCQHSATEGKLFASVLPTLPKDSTVAKPKIKLYSHVERQLDSFFQNQHRLCGLNGCVMIGVKGNPVFEKNYGYGNYTAKDSLNSHSSFQLASVSKTFTSTAILWLVEHGKLSLDDSLQQFFPDFPYHKVLVRHLLSHRSGLPNYLYFGMELWRDKTKYMRNDDLIELMTKRHPPPSGAPGRFFSYCNTNYVLLASIVERVSGKLFKDFMKETFFNPLGMEHTFIYDPFNSSMPNHTISYNSKWQMQGDDPFDGTVGDKGVYSCTEDMLKWDFAFYEGKLLSEQMKREAYSPKSFEHKGVRNYGYGWRLMAQQDGTSLVYHNGWWHGNNTVFYRYPKDTLSIIILSNKFNKGVYNVQPIFDILYNRKGSGHKPENADENE